MTRFEYFSSIHRISESDYKLIIQHLKQRRYKKGEDVVSPSMVQKEVLFVEEGVLMYHFDTNQKSNILGFAYPPNLAIVPESLFLQKPSSYSLTCLSDCEVSYMKYQELNLLFEQSQQIERLFRKMTEIALAGMISRQIELRNTTIEERFTAFCQRSPHLLQLVPHKYIAAYLDINPTNFSKLYNSIKI